MDTVYGLQPGQRWVTPTTYDWNITIERQVRRDILLDVSYVGLRGTHLRQDIDLNPRAAGVGTDASRLFQNFLDIYEDANTGLSNYNALQNDPDVTVNDANFGGIYAAQDPRIIQVALKFFC